MDLDSLQSCLCAGRAALLHTVGFPALHTSSLPGDSGAPGFGSKVSARASSQPAPCPSCCTGTLFWPSLYKIHRLQARTNKLPSLVSVYWALVEEEWLESWFPSWLVSPRTCQGVTSSWGYSLDTDLVFLLLIATFLVLHCLAWESGRISTGLTFLAQRNSITISIKLICYLKEFIFHFVCP